MCTHFSSSAFSIQISLHMLVQSKEHETPDAKLINSNRTTHTWNTHEHTLTLIVSYYVDRCYHIHMLYIHTPQHVHNAIHTIHILTHTRVHDTIHTYIHIHTHTLIHTCMHTTSITHAKHNILYGIKILYEMKFYGFAVVGRTVKLKFGNFYCYVAHDTNGS